MEQKLRCVFIVVVCAFRYATGAPLREDSGVGLHKHDGASSGDSALLENEETSGLKLSALFEFNSHDIWHHMAGYDHPVIKFDPDISYETEQFGTFSIASEIFVQQLGRPR